MRGLCTDLSFIKSSGNEGEVAAIRCKRWTCPHCHELNRRRVIGIARRAKPKALLTLTVNSNDFADPNSAALALKEGLRLLRLRLKRHPRFQNFEFLAVFERHKSGYPHLHLLIRGGFIPWKWLRKTWEGITGSHQIDIRKIKTEGKAVFYITKYIGKDLSAFEGCKRWWRSHNYSEEDTEEYTPEYTYRNQAAWSVDTHALRFFIRASGYNIEPITDERWRFVARSEEALPLDYCIREASIAGGGLGRRMLW